MIKILVASNNKGKIAEIKEIFKDFNILSLKELGIDIDVNEDANTFAGNAQKKAEAILEYVDKDTYVLADDSGLCIDVLNGFPGVNTRRWKEGTDRERNLELIKLLDGKENRKCHFITSIAVANRDNTFVVNESIDGEISTLPKGDNGFGFDEIFLLDNSRTLAELSMEEKNKISARKKALEKAKNYILSLHK